METYHTTIQIIALTLGAAWASGINLYATILVLGVMGHTGNLVLPQELQILADPWVIGAAALMYLVEFLADKIPVFDSVWDGIHTFIRPPSGALLAAGGFAGMDPALVFCAALVGGTVAGVSHGTKAGVRLTVNSSPEPLSNWALSLGEDLTVFLGLWAAMNHPFLFFGLLFLFLVGACWILYRITGIFKRLLRGVMRWFRSPRQVQGKTLPGSSAD